MNTYTFHVNGMHCNSCVLLTESELSEVSEVSQVKASLKNNSVAVTGEFGDRSQEQVASELTTVLQPHGYSLSLQKEKHVVNWSDFKIAFPIAAGFIALYIVLQKLGIVNLVNASEVSYGTAFVIGLIASVSTCMAVVGGVVLSMSANFAKGGDTIRPQVLFHVGRLLTFFVLGGVIGILGSSFQLGGTGTFILNMIVVVVLLILGINLLDVFPWMKRLQPSLPNFLGKKLQKVKNVNHTLTPFLVGVITFVLPCGFTQSMQIYTLTTGSFTAGALTMFSYALGTLPVLALLSFSSAKFYKKAQSGVFFKTAGLVVIFFGLLNLVGGLTVFGIIPPIFNL